VEYWRKFPFFGATGGPLGWYLKVVAGKVIEWRSERGGRIKDGRYRIRDRGNDKDLCGILQNNINAVSYQWVGEEQRGRPGQVRILRRSARASWDAQPISTGLGWGAEMGGGNSERVSVLTVHMYWQYPICVLIIYVLIYLRCICQRSQHRRVHSVDS
jgi:hypothetical protein